MCAEHVRQLQLGGESPRLNHSSDFDTGGVEKNLDTHFPKNLDTHFPKNLDTHFPEKPGHPLSKDQNLEKPGHPLSKDQNLARKED